MKRILLTAALLTALVTGFAPAEDEEDGATFRASRSSRASRAAAPVATESETAESEPTETVDPFASPDVPDAPPQVASPTDRAPAPELPADDAAARRTAPSKKGLPPAADNPIEADTPPARRSSSPAKAAAPATEAVAPTARSAAPAERAATKSAPVVVETPARKSAGQPAVAPVEKPAAKSVEKSEEKPVAATESLRSGKAVEKSAPVGGQEPESAADEDAGTTAGEEDTAPDGEEEAKLPEGLTPKTPEERSDQRAEREFGILEELRRKVAENPNNRDARMRLASFYLFQNDPVKALRQLERAGDLPTGDAFWRMQTAYCQVCLGEYAAALSLLDGATQTVSTAIPLALKNGAFCDEVSGLAQYTPVASGEFKRGARVLFYVEATGAEFTSTDRELFAVDFTISLSFLDAMQRTVKTTPNWASPKFYYRRPVREVFMTGDTVIPEDLAPGKYQMVIEARDMRSGRIATTSVPFTIKE